MGDRAADAARRQALRARSVQRDPHGRRREPLPRPRLLPRPRPQPEGCAARRDAQVLHGLRGAPHDEALGPLARRGAEGAVRRRRGDAARRWRRGVRRPRAQDRRARQGASRHLARGAPPGARHGRADALHDALQPRRDLRGARRPPAAPARPAGRDGRLHGLHPAAVPPREHGLRAARLDVHERPRRPQDAGRLAPHARQHRAHQGVLDHDLDAARPGRPALRRQRHPGHGRRGDDRARRRRGHADRGEGRLARARDPRGRARARCSATRSTTSSAASIDAAPRPRLVHQHLPGRVGAVAPPRSGRGARGRGRPDRAQPHAGRARARRRQRLERRVREQPRALRPAALALRRQRRRRRVGAARHAAAAAGRAQRRGHEPVGDLGRARAGARAPRGDPPRGRGGRRAPADRRRRAALGVLGSDAASRPRRALARAHGAADGVRRLGRAARLRSGRARAHRPRACSGAVAEASEHADLVARAAGERHGFPAGYLARYFEKLRYGFGERERAGSSASTRWPPSAARSRARPSCASPTPLAYADPHGRRCRQPSRPGHPRAGARGSPALRRGRRDAAALARPGVGRARRRRDALAQERPRRGHVHRRPQHQLHQRLRHRLRLLRLLPAPRATRARATCCPSP